VRYQIFYITYITLHYIDWNSVIDPPRWRDRVPPKSIVTAEDEAIQLECRTNGQPPATVTWTINGEPVPGRIAQVLVSLLHCVLCIVY